MYTLVVGISTAKFIELKNTMSMYRANFVSTTPCKSDVVVNGISLNLYQIEIA